MSFYNLSIPNFCGNTPPQFETKNADVAPNIQNAAIEQTPKTKEKDDVKPKMKQPLTQDVFDKQKPKLPQTESTAPKLCSESGGGSN